MQNIGLLFNAKPASNYKRLQRFFRGFDLDYTEIAQIIVCWMHIPQPWVLSVDRTSWELGKHCYKSSPWVLSIRELPCPYCGGYWKRKAIVTAIRE